jgi:copper(I)-binding protein
MSMRYLRFLTWVLLVVFGVTTASAHDAPADLSGIHIRGAWARATAYVPAADMEVLPGTSSAAYMTIENTGETDLTLTHVTTDISADVMLHNTTMDADGVMRMSMMDEGVRIPAGESFTFEQMGPHIMMMDVTRDLFPGDAITLALHFVDDTAHTAELLIGVPVLEFMPDPSDLAVTQIHFHEAMGDNEPTVMLIVENSAAESDRLIEIVPIAPVSPDAAFAAMPAWEAVPVDADPIAAGQRGAVSTSALNDLLAALQEALPGAALALDLRFESGAVLRIAVPTALHGLAGEPADHSDHGSHSG